jgi:hypothetical protein
VADIGSFIGQVLWNWWTVLAGFVIAAEPVTRFLWRGYDEWAAKRLSAPRRRKFARAGALAAFVIANYMAFHDVKQEMRRAQATSLGQTGRHLRPDQQARLASGLELRPNENYSVEFNSLPNCDECEVYAQEFRDFVGGLPGWKTSGGAITFSDPSAPRTGLQLILGDKTSSDVGKKLLAAFATASIPLISRPSEQLQDLDAIIVVARQPK